MSSNPVLKLFEDKECVTISAPMVRYSKLPFRSLVRKYNTDIVFTPMIVSDCFIQSQKSRDIEFRTNEDDTPLVVQFAASNSSDFADAAQYVEKYADAVDLNCGCPQSWAMGDGLGSYLIRHPEKIADMVQVTRNRVNIPISVKVRIHKDHNTTVEMAKRAEKAGAAFISVHGRTPQERTSPVQYDAIKLVKENLSIPVVANGDAFSLKDVKSIHEKTHADGVMSARGILANPALFAGYDCTPLECIQDYVNLALDLGTPFTIFHHHLIFMTDKAFSKAEHREFCRLTSVASVLIFLERYGISQKR